MRGVVDMKGGPTDGGQPLLNKPLRPSGDFAADEEAHRRQVADHWAEGERFNLRQAFKSQMDRIEADWETYLQEMEQECVPYPSCTQRVVGGSFHRRRSLTT